jgi:hypothetical protein
MSQSRKVRVDTPPIPVRIARASGRLINVSASGALVQLNRALTAGSEQLVHVTMDPAPIELHARVIRSHAVQVEMNGAIWNRQEHKVALVFTNLSTLARDAIRDLCGAAFSAEE